MRIIDAHHHLWDLERHAYPWLKPEIRHPAGDLAPICKSYRLSDFLADAKNQDLAHSVHLQAAMADPLAETAWLQSLADAPGSGSFPHAIVAWADLADPGVEQVLERHCTHPNVRGIRFMLNYLPGEPLYCMTDRPTGPPRASAPLVLDTIAIFGADRCLFASNFPLDKLMSDYDAIWQAFDEITADFSEAERRKLFHDNAPHFYRLGK